MRLKALLSLLGVLQIFRQLFLWLQLFLWARQLLLPLEVTKWLKIPQLVNLATDSIVYENMYINSKLLDHNLVKFGINIVSGESPIAVLNPYNNKIFEYDTSKEDDA